MHLTVVGSGSASPDPERVGPCFHLQAGRIGLLLDCGPGAVHHLARFGLAWDQLTHVVLSHFHTDHIGDLAALFFALRHAPAEPGRGVLTLLGPAGTGLLIDRLAEAYGAFMLEPGLPLDIHELADGDMFRLDPDTELRAWRVPHTTESLAFSIQRGGRVLGYTGDTGPDEDLGTCFKGVDLLIAECSVPEDMELSSHLSPADLASLARAASPRRLLVTHVFPELARSADPLRLIREAGWNGETIRAQDGMKIQV